MDEEAFLEWLDEQDARIRNEVVYEEWPEFFEEYTVRGVTMTADDDGEPLIPKRDLRDAVIYGQPLD